MILAFSLTAAVLFGTGAFMLLERDLVRVVVGVALISQAAAVTLIGASLTRGPAAIGAQPGESVADPVPQALVLTALVIGLATLALLLALANHVIIVHRTAEHEELAAHETEHEESLEADQQRDRDEAT